MVATEQIAIQVYKSTGCPCGWESFATFMTVAILRQLHHQADCPASSRQAD